jgi:hypothetical protein
VPLALVGIGLLLAAFVAYATSQQGHAWADAIVNWFSGWLIKLPIIGESIASLIAKGATWISNRLGHLYLGLEQPVVNWVGAIGKYVQFVSDATLDAPVQLLSAVRWLVTSEIPYLIHALPNSVTALVHAAQRELGALERQVAKDVAGFAGLSRKIATAILLGFLAPYLASIRYFAHLWRKIAHAAAHAGGIAVPWIEVPRLRREERAISKRLGKVEKLLGVTALAGVMAGVFGVTRSCLTRGNVGRTARSLCGVPSHLLDDFLALLADFLVIENICRVLPWLEAGVSEVATPLVEAITTVGAGLCDPSSSVSAPLPVPALHLTATPALTTALV